MAFTVLRSVVVVTAGPGEVEGHTQNLLINSHNDQVLFRADGEQTLIGPDKLRITGALMSPTYVLSLGGRGHPSVFFSPQDLKEPCSSTRWRSPC